METRARFSILTQKMRVRVNDFFLLSLGVGETGLVFTINIFQVLFLKVNFCIGTYFNVLIKLIV